MRDTVLVLSLMCVLVPCGLGGPMRTDRGRLVEWRKAGSPNIYELYDHQNDPEENENLANKPEHSAIVKELSAMLREKLKAKP